MPSLREYAARYQISTSAAAARPAADASRPREPRRRAVGGERSTRPQALIGDQVKAGVAVRMAVLYELLVGSPILAAVA